MSKITVDFSVVALIYREVGGKVQTYGWPMCHFFIQGRMLSVNTRPDPMPCTENDADELIEFVKQLKDEVEAWLEKEHPELV